MKKSKTTIDQYIMDGLKSKNPKTVKELVKLVRVKHPIPEQEILDAILRLRDQGVLALKEYPARLTPSLKSYIFSTKANWCWIIIAVAAATVALVFAVPENAYPLVYARYALGSIFVLFLPGYSFIKVLFPTEELDDVERVALSIGMSLALVLLTGLLLNCTPLGIRMTPVTLSLLPLTITFTTAAIIKEHKLRLKENHQKRKMKRARE